MSTPNPTHIVAAAFAGTSPTSTQRFEDMSHWDQQRWLTRAEHVVSKLTDAGYSIVPTPPLTAEQRDPDGNHIFDQGDDLAVCIECGVTRSEHQGARTAAAEGEKL